MNRHLSIVATTRNDNHGGTIAARTQAFADSLQLAAPACSFDTELIVVDWNPPPGAAPLSEAIRWPTGDHIRTRIITVPAEIHQRYRSAAAMPLFQMIAKNVGIRRAAGEFILATNVNVIFPADLYEMLGPAYVKPGVLFRASRVDVAAEPVLGEADPTRRIDACANNVVAIHARRCNFTSKKPLTLDAARGRLPAAAIRFLALRARAVARLSLSPRRMKSDLWFHWNTLEELSGNGWHNNACGDFTLMHGDDWNRIGGYWEYDGYSMHIDTIGIYAARAAGVRHEILKPPVYHVEHSGGWTMAGEKDGSFWAGMRARGLDFLPNEAGMVMLKKALATGEPLYVNPPDWGLRDEDLAETVLGLA